MVNWGYRLKKLMKAGSTARANPPTSFSQLSDQSSARE
jgi:hypothetical protein